MTVKRDAAERFTLSRWSRRKLQSAALSPGSNPAVPAVAPPHSTAAGPSAVRAAAPVDLPPIESLCFDSDFTAFLRPEVDETLKRAALKQLFRDPRFNVMDGLDTYIDDYTKADPIPPAMLAGLLERFERQNAPAAPASEEAESGSAHPPPITPAAAANARTGKAEAMGVCADDAAVPAKDMTEAESRRDVAEEAAGAEVPSADALGTPAENRTAPPLLRETTEPVAADPIASSPEHR